MTLTELVERRIALQGELQTVTDEIVSHVESQRAMLDGIVAQIGRRRDRRGNRTPYTAERRAKTSEAMRAAWVRRKAANGSGDTMHQ